MSIPCNAFTLMIMFQNLHGFSFVQFSKIDNAQIGSVLTYKLCIFSVQLLCASATVKLMEFTMAFLTIILCKILHCIECVHARVT